jgi:hypothetical protein
MELQSSLFKPLNSENKLKVLVSAYDFGIMLPSKYGGPNIILKNLPAKF